jgi:hypothetical protein
VSFDHVLVKPEGEGFTAVGQVDAEGTYGGTAQVSYIGLERVPFVRRGGRWVPRARCCRRCRRSRRCSWLPRRGGRSRPGRARAPRGPGLEDERVAREEAIAAMKERLSAGPQKAQPKRWIVRVERERSEVLEETSAGSTRLELVREAGRLRIASGTL